MEEAKKPDAKQVIDTLFKGATLPPNLERAITNLLSGETGQDPNEPCVKCGKPDIKDPIYDRDLGGPFCGDTCYEAVQLDAMHSRYEPE